MSESSEAEDGPSSALQKQVYDIASSDNAMRVYGVTRRFLHRVAWPYLRISFINKTNLSVPGPVIYAPVHRSNLDAPLVASGVDRRLRALAKESLFSNRAVRWYISSLGAFPVDRGAADRESLRIAASIIEQGDPMLIFPEGTRQTGRQVGEVFDGVAFLAARTQAPVVPVGIAGTEEAMASGSKRIRRSTVVIAAGDLMHVPLTDKGRLSVKGRKQFSNDLRVALQLLMDQAYARRDELLAAKS